jgi:hypothetical protein
MAFIKRLNKRGAFRWTGQKKDMAYVCYGKQQSQREHTRPACRFEQLSSARANQSLYFERLTRETRMLLYCVAASAGRAQATPLIRRQNLISKTIPQRCQVASTADYLLNHVRAGSWTRA